MHGLKNSNVRGAPNTTMTIGGAPYKLVKGPMVPDDLKDFKYGSEIVHRLIRIIMPHGKLRVAERIVYGAMRNIGELTGEDPLTVVERAIQNITPNIENRTSRVKGGALQVPIEPSPHRATSMGMRWLHREIGKQKKKTRQSYQRILTQELIDASNNMGLTVRKRDDVYRMAEANKVNLRNM